SRGESGARHSEGAVGGRVQGLQLTALDDQPGGVAALRAQLQRQLPAAAERDRTAAGGGDLLGVVVLGGGVGDGQAGGAERGPGDGEGAVHGGDRVQGLQLPGLDDQALAGFRAELQGELPAAAERDGGGAAGRDLLGGAALGGRVGDVQIVGGERGA